MNATIADYERHSRLVTVTEYWRQIAISPQCWRLCTELAANHSSCSTDRV